MTVDQCDVRIFQVQQLIKKLDNKIKNLEKNSLMTSKMLKKATDPFYAEKAVLQQKEQKLEFIKDSKIPAYEKIDKGSAMYKHLMQMMFNERIDKTAKDQKKEDKKMLKDIGEGISAQRV